VVSPLAVVSPLDGQFYTRSGPDAPPFAPLGAEVAPGATIGLVEVMKFFYPVRYEGEVATVSDGYLVADGTPVHAGQAVWQRQG
jgi:acetyl-CoA carboxylase biotin carboxyl carrier protein